MLRAAAGLVALALLLGSTPTAQGDTRVRRGFDYEVTFAADLSVADVRICFRRFMPRTLVMRDPAALAAVQLPDGAGAASLVPTGDGRGMRPVGLRPGGCIRYRVDLGRAAAIGGRRGGGRIGRDLFMNPGQLLLRPSVWPDSIYVTCRFVCPGGYAVSVPWAPLPGATTPHTYVVSLAGVNIDAILAVGRFTPQTVSSAGAAFSVVRLDRAHAADETDIEAWIGSAARAVAGLFGTFPVPAAQVLVVPGGAGRTPVTFGRARRSGGASITFYLSATADKSTLVGEWVGVHEMIHLGMPWTQLGEAWLQEGFTTYYQEVLRARAGFQSVRAGWQQIHEGFGRGKRGASDATTLAQASAGMHQSHAYWHVYWGGCATALLCDLEIRRVTRGVRSLDDVMRYLGRQFSNRRSPQKGLDLMRAADRWLGQPICTPIAERMLAAKGFPDLSATYAALGLVVDGRTLRLDPSAPRAKDAQAIMSAPHVRRSTSR